MKERLSPNEEWMKKTSEKLWENTKETLNRATFKAGQYKAIVQHRIEMGSIHRRIGNLHQDLGMRIDELHAQGDIAPLQRPDVLDLLTQLQELKKVMATLEHEIEELRSAEPPASAVVPGEVMPREVKPAGMPPVSAPPTGGSPGEEPPASRH